MQPSLPWVSWFQPVRFAGSHRVLSAQGCDSSSSAPGMRLWLVGSCPVQSLPAGHERRPHSPGDEFHRLWSAHSETDSAAKESKEGHWHILWHSSSKRPVYHQRDLSSLMLMHKEPSLDPCGKWRKQIRVAGVLLLTINGRHLSFWF